MDQPGVLGKEDMDAGGLVKKTASCVEWEIDNAIIIAGIEPDPGMGLDLNQDAVAAFVEL